MLCLSIPGVMDPAALLACWPLAVVMALSLVRMGRDTSLLMAALALVAGMAILIVPHLPIDARNGAALATALLPIGAGALASLGLVLTFNPLRWALLAAGAVFTVLLIEPLTPGVSPLSAYGVIVALAWALAGFVSLWTNWSVPRAARRIRSIGRAHRTERQASETEAQRRQGARLLHDTVLATLTLLAHSGVGVSPEALRAQAAEDAELLRQLRLGASPVPATQSQPSTSDAPGEQALGTTLGVTLGVTLESVKQRFGRMGLQVSWHGTGQVLLRPDALDAFLKALAECLENVRRHAGVTDAHVTITDDDTTVRAMVTDSGAGFDVDDIDAARMGLKDSVIGRLAEVGGTARLFSAPGAGTTVVLEVPK